MRADGSINTELPLGIGVSWSAFSILQRLWSHTAVSRQRKVEMPQAVVARRLLDGLVSAWLNAADQRRLNGVQGRRVRRIAGRARADN